MSKNKGIKTVVEQAKSIIKKKDEQITVLQKKLTEANGQKTVTFKMPDIMEVKNFPDVQKVKIENHPDVQRVKIENHQKVQSVKIENHPETQQVRIINTNDIKSEIPKIQDVRIVANTESDTKSSKWVPEIVKHAAGAIVGGIVRRLDLGIVMRADPEDKLTPQLVVVVDARGRPVDFSKMGSNTIIPMPNSPGGNPPPTKIYAGHLTLTTSPQQLSTTVRVCRRVIITAPATNSGFVYVGDSTVSTTTGAETGAMLTPTGSITLEIDDLSKVYAVAQNSTDIISFTYLR